MPVNKKNKAYFIKYSLPVLVYSAVIFYLSSIHGEDIPRLFNFQDLVFHFLEYGIFSLLVSRALNAYYPKHSQGRRFLWAFFFSFIYAASDEFHQSFVPGRCPSLYDLGYDSMGIVVAGILYGIAKMRFPSEKQLGITKWFFNHN